MPRRSGAGGCTAEPPARLTGQDRTPRRRDRRTLRLRQEQRLEGRRARPRRRLPRHRRRCTGRSTWWCLERGSTSPTGCRGRRRARPPPRGRHRPRRPTVSVGGTDVTEAIRRQGHTVVSAVATNLEVRAERQQLQRDLMARSRSRPGSGGRGARHHHGGGRTPASGCSSRHPRRPGCGAARLSRTGPRCRGRRGEPRPGLRRDRDDSTVLTFTEAARASCSWTPPTWTSSRASAVLDVVAAETSAGASPTRGGGRAGRRPRVGAGFALLYSARSRALDVPRRGAVVLAAEPHRATSTAPGAWRWPAPSHFLVLGRFPGVASGAAALDRADPDRPAPR